MSGGAGVKKLKCRTHGKAPWRFTIVCLNCQRVYQARLEGEPFEPLVEGVDSAPEVCLCGSTLGPPQGSARAICSKCYIERATPTLKESRN